MIDEELSKYENKIFLLKRKYTDLKGTQKLNLSDNKDVIKNYLECKNEIIEEIKSLKENLKIVNREKGIEI